MKHVKYLLSLALVALGIALLVGCTATTGTTPTGAPVASLTPAQRIQAVALTIDTNCQVGAIPLASLIAVQTDPGAIDLLNKFQTQATKVCKVASAIAHPVVGAGLPTLDLAGAKNFLDAETPALVALVNKSNLEQAKKSAAILAITGAQLAITMASLNQS